MLGHSDLPQLLHPPLDERLGDDIHPPFAHGAQEIGSLLEGKYRKPLAPHVIVLA